MYNEYVYLLILSQFITARFLVFPASQYIRAGPHFPWAYHLIRAEIAKIETGLVDPLSQNL